MLMFSRARSDITAGGADGAGGGLQAESVNSFTFRRWILRHDVFFQFIISHVILMYTFQVSTEVICPWPYLSPAFTRGHRTRVSIPGSSRIWVYTPLMSVQVIRGAESFTTSTVGYIATVGFGMSLCMLPDGGGS